MSLAHLSAALVNPRDPFPEAADEFIVKSTAQFRQIFYRDPVAAVFSDQSDRIHKLCLRDIRHIDHELIHADPPQDPCTLSMNEHISLI